MTDLQQLTDWQSSPQGHVAGMVRELLTITTALYAASISKTEADYVSAELTDVDTAAALLLAISRRLKSNVQ